MSGEQPDRMWMLRDHDNRPYASPVPGAIGGNAKAGIYGRLDCPSALSALARGLAYAQHRVFFADEATALAAGFRPCGNCMRDAYRLWKASRDA